MIFDQTFSLFDIPRVFLLMFLEIILSADNALVMGMLVHHLPSFQRSRALFVGLFSAFLLRGLSLFFISSLLHMAWIQLIGAAYLLFLSIRYFLGSTKEFSFLEATKGGFWKTVVLIEIFDLAFALDSILAGLAFITTLPSGKGGRGIHPKLWIVYLGTILGLLVIRFAAKLFSEWITVFPNLKRAAHLIVGWIGIKLIVTASDQMWGLPLPWMAVFETIYWIVFTGLFLSGFVKIKKA